MSETAERVKDLESQLEVKQDELAETECDLKAQIESKQEEMARLEEALTEAQWQERLERVEEHLGEFYREERKIEDEINRAINKVFNSAAKDVKKINTMFKDLDGLKKKMSDIKTQLIRSDDDHNGRIKEAIEFKKAEIIREIEVAEEVKGGIPLVREVNVALGVLNESDKKLFGRAVSTLPVYAQNIHDEVKRAGGKPLRARWDELIRLARIPEPRIIKARDELKKNMELLIKKGLIAYEEKGDTLFIREISNEEERR